MDTPVHVTFALDADRHVHGVLYASASQPAIATFVLAHGAGAPQSHPFIVGVAHGLASRGCDVVTFNFPYMEARRKLPDAGPVLEACYAAVVRQVRASTRVVGQPMVIGGKSMGGRIASQVVARDPETAAAVSALVFLGYPLHPPGKTDGSPRSRHLPDVRKPMLFVQGSRDAFGTPAELEPIIRTLVPRPTLIVVDGGDHSFSTPKTKGKDPRLALEPILDAVARWIRGTTNLQPATCNL